MTVKIPNLPDIHFCGPLCHGFFDDFDHYVAADRWSLVADTSGTAAVGDAVGGEITVTSHSDDNDESYLVSTEELFKFADGKPFLIMGRIKFTEANTDDANIIFGVMDAAAGDALLDNGGGPAASYDGAVFFKVDGGTRWQVESSNAGTQTTHDTEESAGGGSYQTLAILVTPINSSEAEVTFWIDPNGGQDLYQVRENGANPRTPSIKQTLSLSGLEEMHIILGAKAGGANAEAVICDYISAWQKR